jgi:hypothetical protein
VSGGEEIEVGGEAPLVNPLRAFLLSTAVHLQFTESRVLSMVNVYLYNDRIVCE